jgi:hypothetical protein
VRREVRARHSFATTIVNCIVLHNSLLFGYLRIYFTIFCYLLSTYCNSIKSDRLSTLHTTGDGSTTTVCVSSIMSAGPSTKSPSLRSSIWKTGVSTRPVSSKYTEVVSTLPLLTGWKSSLSASSKTLGPSVLNDLPIPRTRMSSTMIDLLLRTKPNLQEGKKARSEKSHVLFSGAPAHSCLYVSSNIERLIQPSSGMRVIRAVSVPSYLIEQSVSASASFHHAAKTNLKFRYSSTTICLSSNPAASSCFLISLESTSSLDLRFASVPSLSKVSELGSCFSNTLNHKGQRISLCIRQAWFSPVRQRHSIC